MVYEPTVWADGATGGTPLSAANLNKMEAGIAEGQNAAEVKWGNLPDKPTTFAPTIGTTSTTALAGNTALLKLGTTSATALAGDTALLKIGTTATTAAKGDHVHVIANVTGLEARLAAIEGRLTTLEAV